MAFLIFLFANIWIWKIFQFNFLVFVVTILATFFLYRSVKEKKLDKVFVVLFLFLLIFQFKTTKIIPLAELSNQEKLYQIQRLKEYPPVYIKLFNKNLWVPTANWFENKPWLLSLYRIKNNIGDAVSPNLYFFSNHPNERVGFKEFEKFPYILLPFFVIGFLSFDFKKNLKIFMFSFGVPIVLTGLIGQSNSSGVVSLFPIIFVLNLLGVEYLYERYKKKRWAIILFLFLYSLVFIQTIIYARY